MEAKSVRIHYWPATGKAECIRLLLADAGRPFENVGFEKLPNVQIYRDPASFRAIRESEAAQAFFAQCKSLCGNLTTNVPFLDVDGERFNQSLAIYKHVARLTGLYPDSPAQAYIVDVVLCHAEDAFGPPYQVLFGGLKLETFKEQAIPNHLGNFERLLAAGGGEYFTGRFTLADLRVFDILVHLYERTVPGTLRAFPLLSSLVERVAARPRIAAYLKSEQYAATDKMFPFEP